MLHHNPEFAGSEFAGITSARPPVRLATEIEHNKKMKTVSPLAFTIAGNRKQQVKKVISFTPPDVADKETEQEFSGKFLSIDYNNGLVTVNVKMDKPDGNKVDTLMREYDCRVSSDGKKLGRGESELVKAFADMADGQTFEELMTELNDSTPKVLVKFKPMQMRGTFKASFHKLSK